MNMFSYMNKRRRKKRGWENEKNIKGERGNLYTGKQDRRKLKEEEEHKEGDRVGTVIPG